MPQGPAGEFGEPNIAMKWNAADDIHTTTADYAKFLISAMNREMLTDEVAAKRIRIYEDQLVYLPGEISPELLPEHAGFGLGWTVFDSGDDTILTHSGGDWGERTLGFYIPERRMGAVVFTNGANGQKVIRDVVSLLYPDPVYVALLNALAEVG